MGYLKLDSHCIEELTLSCQQLTLQSPSTIPLPLFKRINQYISRETPLEVDMFQRMVQCVDQMNQCIQHSQSQLSINPTNSTNNSPIPTHETTQTAILYLDQFLSKLPQKVQSHHLLRLLVVADLLALKSKNNNNQYHNNNINKDADMELIEKLSGVKKEDLIAMEPIFLQSLNSSSNNPAAVLPNQNCNTATNLGVDIPY